MSELLSDSEVLDLAARGALPARFCMTLATRELRPTLPPGATVELVRRRAVAGDLVLLAAGGRLVWRRVLAVRGDELLLRREVSAFADGWFAGSLAVVEPRAWRQRLVAGVAARFPGAWTRLAWWAAWTAAAGRNLVPAARARLAARHRFSVRVLAGEADGAAFAAFHERTVGLAATLPADGGVTVGLFAGEALVGVVYLDLGAHRGLCSSMLIAPEQRGHGGAVLLLGALVTEARRRGLTVLTAEVDVRNFASRATTRRLGFVTVGPAPRDGDPFDGSERELLVLHLDPPPPR